MRKFDTWNYNISIPAAPLTAWFFMLALGSAHSEFAYIPNLGYVPLFLFSICFVMAPWDSLAYWKAEGTRR